jgi:hypothetical protein
MSRASTATNRKKSVGAGAKLDRDGAKLDRETEQNWNFTQSPHKELYSEGPLGKMGHRLAGYGSAGGQPERQAMSKGPRPGPQRGVIPAAAH